MESVLLLLLSAVIGFIFSQLFDFIAYYRRPKFRVGNHSDGVLSAYTGDPPETPWEIELGFFLENFGKNPSRNTRIFASEVCVWDSKLNQFEETNFSFAELSRPIDILPAGECVRVLFAKITREECCLEMPFESQRDAKANEYLASDTRFGTRFRAKFYVLSDDKNSSEVFTLIFDPSADEEWTAKLLEEYDSADFRRSVVMPTLG